MPFQLTAKKTFIRDIKKLCRKDKALKNYIQGEIEKILLGEVKGEQLRGNLKGARKHKFGRKPEMRLIYAVGLCSALNECSFKYPESGEHSISECCGVVTLIWVRSREEMNNLYNKSKKQLGDFLAVEIE